MNFVRYEKDIKIMRGKKSFFIFISKMCILGIIKLTIMNYVSVYYPSSEGKGVPDASVAGLKGKVS